MPKPRVLILQTSDGAAPVRRTTLERLLAAIGRDAAFGVTILVIDDQGVDGLDQLASGPGGPAITVLANPTLQGDGGIQKIGCLYAIEQGFDVLVSLRGSDALPPGSMGRLVAPLLDGQADVVFGSRLLNPQAAGGFGRPFWRNRVLGSQLADLDARCRAFTVRALASVPFDRNSDGAAFDTELLVQMIDTAKRIEEIALPATGDHPRRTYGLRSAALTLGVAASARVMRLGILYDPRFDYESDNAHYAAKFGYASSHQFAFDRVREDSVVLDVGCGPGFMARKLLEKRARTISLDRHIGGGTRDASIRAIETDVEAFDFSDTTKVDTVLLLDIIEHLVSPERFLARLRERYCADQPEVVITTGNIAFLPLRLALLCGQFNYGKRGILDLTHTRLFTFASLRRLLQQSGFEVIAVSGLPAPFPLALGDKWPARLLARINSMLIAFSKGLFSYQIAMVVRVRPTLGLLLQRARADAAQKLAAG